MKTKKRDKKAIITGRGKRKYDRQALEHTDTQSCPGGTMLVTWVPKKGVHHNEVSSTELQSPDSAD